jgi:transposase
MEAVNSKAKPEQQLPDLDTLDVAALKALVLAKQSELDSRGTEIENLKLLILKLKRMHFGPRSEKFDHDIEQLELRLEDLEANQAAAEPLTVAAATVVLNQKASRKPARRPLPAELPRETEIIAPRDEACPDYGGTLRPLGEDVSETLEYVPSALQSYPHGAPEAKLRVLFTHRTGTGAAPAHRSGTSRSWASRACSGREVCRPSPSVPPIRNLRAEGIDLDRATLADWVGGVSRTVRPLVEALKKYVLSAEKLHGDDVPVPVLEPGNGKTKTGRLWTGSVAFRKRRCATVNLDG